MPEINAIATIHGHAGFQRLAQFSTSTAAKELAGFTMRFDRIKVPSGGGTTYVLPEPDVNGNTDFREIEVTPKSCTRVMRQSRFEFCIGQDLTHSIFL